jgi:vacuolar-type H+-ATPase subunit D/Vma8
MRRLEVGRRGAEVLEQKRGTLLRERLRLAGQLAQADAEWERAAAAAADWNARAWAAAGPRALRLAALRRGGTATVTVTRRNILGVVVPDSAVVEGEAPTGDASAGGAAVRLAAEVHAEALSAAATVAALRSAHEAIEAELARTIRRLRAIEHRWLPTHEAELHRLELALQESELADIARARWAVGRKPTRRG